MKQNRTENGRFASGGGGGPGRPPSTRKGRLQRLILECRSQASELRSSSRADPSRADEFLALAAETDLLANEAERLLNA